MPTALDAALRGHGSGTHAPMATLPNSNGWVSYLDPAPSDGGHGVSAEQLAVPSLAAGAEGGGEVFEPLPNPYPDAQIEPLVAPSSSSYTFEEISNPLDNNKDTIPQGTAQEPAVAVPLPARAGGPSGTGGAGPFASNVSGVVDDSERRVFNSRCVMMVVM